MALPPHEYELLESLTSRKKRGRGGRDRTRRPPGAPPRRGRAYPELARPCGVTSQAIDLILRRRRKRHEKAALNGG